MADFQIPLKLSEREENRRRAILGQVYKAILSWPDPPEATLNDAHNPAQSLKPAYVHQPTVKVIENN